MDEESVCVCERERERDETIMGKGGGNQPHGCQYAHNAMVYHWRTPVNRLSSLMKRHTRFRDVYDREDLSSSDRMCVAGLTLIAG